MDMIILENSSHLSSNGAWKVEYNMTLCTGKTNVTDKGFIILECHRERDFLATSD